ncbi:ABC transporter ATP-binding protein [Nonomuraea sp. NPDC050556]|uniref:ABC transporter ATP-binding protein n=1 Tax=Nonomuraea sp. NPDC050556 TaxID=3364369 RepID=UPI0037901F18
MSPRTPVLQALRPRPSSVLALTAAIAAATALPLLAPQLTRTFVDDAIGGATTGSLAMIALAYLGIAVAGQAVRMLTAWLASRLAWDGTNRLRERLAGHALGLDLAFHGEHTPGEMIERVDGDVVAIADFVVAFLMDVVAGFLLLCGVLVVVFAVDVRLGAALLVYCVLVGYGMALAQRLAVPSAAEARAANATMIGTLEERLAGAEDLRANGAGEHAVRRFLSVSAEWFWTGRRASMIGSGLIAGTSVAFAAGTALMLGLAASGAFSVGTGVLLFQYTLMVRTPFERLIDQLRQYQSALAGFARVGELLSTPRTVPVPAAPVPLPGLGALSLRFDGVGFAYGGARVLSGVDLTLAPGETLGLVGRTGAGKTTLARLAVRLYDPGEGRVLVGGVDLRDVSPGSLRARVSVVTQDVQLFAASVRDNLTLFRPALGDDLRLCEVLEEVGLGDWLARLPKGLDTTLGNASPDAGGSSVSAGEAQLLAFARAFLTDPGLVVLDEASSRLDPASERRIEHGMDRLLGGRTAIVIAHRPSSLAKVDRIAVVGDGRILEYGRREELAADPDSRFARMLAFAGSAADVGGVR